MGEARRRREGKGEAVYAAQVPMLEAATVLLTKQVAEAVRERHKLVAKQFATRAEFLAALIVNGLEVFDRDLAAAIAHARGETKPVAEEAV